MIKYAAVLYVLVALFAGFGCGPRRDQGSQAQRSPFATDDESEFVCAVVVDLSGSFHHLMAEDGFAYVYTLKAIDRYFRDRIGSPHDRLVLIQVSGTKRSILWEGVPHNFKKQFNADSFRKFLESRADPAGSLVHDGIAHGIEYIMTIPSVANGKAKSVTLILSDMLDTGPDQDRSEKRLHDAFVRYLQKGGHLGFYFVDQLQMVHWRDKMAAAGYHMIPFSHGESLNPPLPSFE